MPALGRRLIAWALSGALLAVIALVALVANGCASLLGADFDRGGAGTDIDGGVTGGDGSVITSPDGATTADGATGGPCVRDDAADCAGKCGELKGRCGQVITCGGCPTGQSCGGGGTNTCGSGACTPSCAGKVCGDNDGCSSVCVTGACGSGLRCIAGTCACDTTSCPGCCDGNACKPGGDDTACGKGGTTCTVCKAGTSCGTGDCGTCGGSGQPCCAGNQCASPGTCGGGGQVGVCGCTPSCAGKTCGASDGCGGTCNAGSCAFGLHCSGGTCACDGTSCSGCCQAGQCIGGTQTSGCGKGGVGCAVCPAPTSGGTAACDGTSCGVSCNSGYSPCGVGQCCQNKTIFVAAGSFTGNLGGLSGADTTCQTQGAPFGGTFKAWLSDSQQTAAGRLTHSMGPYFLYDGVTRVANDWNGLVSGTLLHEIDRTATGTATLDEVIRTGTTPSGAYSGMSCRDWASGANADGSGYGQSNQNGAKWTQNGTLNVACDYSPTSFYCVQQ